MKIRGVTLTNYGSFAGKHHFRLSDRGLVIVLGENKDEPRMNSNGAGKSTVFDALDWCLFGDVPRGDHADSIVNEAVGKDCEVEVELEDGEHQIMVRRFRKVGGSQSGVILMVDRVELTALDSKETQAIIERQLGLDREVFHAVVYFAQGDLFNFAEATDSERMEVASKIFQMGGIDDFLDLAKVAFNAQQMQVVKITSDRTNLMASLQSLDVVNYRREAGQWDETRAQSLRQALQQLNDFMVHIDQQRKVVSREALVHANLEAAKFQVETGALPLDWGRFDSTIAQTRDEEQGWKSKLYRTRTEGTKLKERTEWFQKNGKGDCAECGQPITAEHVTKEIAKLSREVEALRAQYIDEDRQAKLAEAKVRELEASKEEQRKLHMESDRSLHGVLREAQIQMKAVEDAKAYLTKAEPHVAYLRGQMAETQAKVNPWLQKEQEVEQQKSDLRLNLATIDQQLRTSEEHARYYDFWVHGFGPKGLKSYILDSRLQELTDAANEWVKMLTGGTIWVRFETQTLGRSTGKLANKINVRVMRYNPNGTISERNYRSWSGGEKRRVRWAIDFGLSRLVAQRATKRYDLLVLDEVLSYMDASGKEAVMEMLRALRREKSSIFVVEHDADFQAQFDNRILVRKQGGNSRILEESDADQGQATIQPGRQLQAPGEGVGVQGAQPQGTAVGGAGGVPTGEVGEAPRRKRRSRSSSSVSR